MFKLSLYRTVFFGFLSLTFSVSAFAQLCGGPLYPPCPPTTTPAPTPTTTTPTPTPTPSPTPAPPVTTTLTTPNVSASGIPGYTQSSNYGMGRTVAYIVAPFAAVAGTYFLGHHHQIEINPNAGFFFPGQTDSTQFRNEGLYSVRANAYATDSIQVEGNFGFINHFESQFAPTPLDQSFGIQPRSIQALLYDVNGLYDFGRRPMFGGRISPYVVAGVGGLSTRVRQDTAALVGGQFYATDAPTGAIVLDSGRKVIVADNSPFFCINYGGGIKATKLWGPMGIRADFRGRTFPNFRGEKLTWPEATAGLTFTFGER